MILATAAQGQVLLTVGRSSEQDEGSAATRLSTPTDLSGARTADRAPAAGAFRRSRTERTARFSAPGSV